MVFLLFQIGDDGYALEARRVVEVLPLVTLKSIPRAPAGVAGLFDFRGRPVPVIDLSALATDRPSRAWLSTRVVLVELVDRGVTRLVGLVAERATQMLRCDPGAFADAGVRAAEAPWLGPVSNDGRGLVQRVEVDQLLSETVREALFGPAAAGAA
jgi:chemotaxis-related protein WspB